MVYSNWRQELTEVMTDKEDDKKVTEKNVKNKIIINPKLGEAIEAMGGQLLEMVEMAQPDPQEKEKEDPKQKKISQVKKQVLMKKMQAVRQGAGADIVAHYEPEGKQIDEKKGCSHTHEGEECPVHGKKECPDTVAAEMDEGVLDAALETDKKMGELHKKVDKDVKRMKAGKKFKEEVELDERTRYAKETGKDFKTGNPSEKGGTRTGKSAFDQVSRQMRKTGGVMSSRGKAIQPQGKKKEPGKKGYKGVTPVDKIRNRLAQKRAAKPNPYRARAGESD